MNKLERNSIVVGPLGFHSGAVGFSCVVLGHGSTNGPVVMGRSNGTEAINGTPVILAAPRPPARDARSP